MLLKIFKFILNLKYALLAFVLPLAAACICFSKLKVAPFGEFSLLNMDLWGQYFPMYADQYNHRSQLSLFFSWNGGLGFNSFAQSAYYCNSLFLLILLLFKSGSLIMVLDLIILSKFGLASLTCFFFLRYKFKKENMLTVAFSVAYSLCAYMGAFMTQPMWTDVVILLPLVLIGLERMLTAKKPLFYCLSLAILIFSSFYIGFSVCIFLILYFLAFALSSYKNFSRDLFFRQAKYFAGFSLLAGGLTAFTILPIYNAIKLTVASDLSSPDKLKFYHSIWEYLSNMLPFSSISLEYGVPNIYSGGFVFLLLPLFIFNANISRRKRIVFSSLIVLFYFSLNFNILDYVWHGFHLPNQLPGRWSFIFSLMIILICYESLIKCKSQYWKIIAALPAALFLILFGGSVAVKHEINAPLIAFLTILLISVLVYLLYSKKFKIINQLIIFALGLVIIAEAVINAAVVIPRDVKVSKIKEYQFADDKMADIVLKYDSGRDDFYRMELIPKYTFNPGMKYNYKGISYYSSTMNGGAYDFFKSMGYEVYAQNVSTIYNPNYPALNSVFNVKYLIQRSGDENFRGFEQIDIIDDYKILENKYYLPFAFTVSDNLAGWKPDPAVNTIRNQNAFIRAAVYNGEDIYKPLPDPEMIFANAELTPDEDWNKQYYKRLQENEPVIFNFKYEINKTSTFLLTHGFRAGEIYISDGIKSIQYDTRSPVIDLGQIEAGTELIITVSVSNIFIGVWGIELFAFDETAFEYCYDYLNKDPVEIISAGDTNIKCRMKSGSGGMLFTSVPAAGWSLKCNGVKTETFKIGEFLLAAEIPPGESELEFSYGVPGLIPGLIISFCCLGILIFSLYRLRKVYAPFIQPEEDDTETDDKNEESFKKFYQKFKKAIKTEDEIYRDYENDNIDNIDE